MKRFLGVVVLFCFCMGHVLAQDKVWKLGVNSFFDNTEFGNSGVQIPQTMAGVHVAPEVGLSWGGVHCVYVGADVLHEYGSNKAVDRLDPIAYYSYGRAPFRFYMGAFPRKLVLEDYPRLFFTDSIHNYRPNINGLCWEFSHGKSYIRAWLDWTSRQTYTRNETFFMGESARLSLGEWYVQHFGYMFHYAGVMNPVVPEALHDNGLYRTSLGVDLSERTGWDKLDFSLGWAVGVEDARQGVPNWLKHHAIMAEAKVEYRGLGLENSLYAGNRQMAFYDDHGMNLYWGDRVYRAQRYDRSDFYIRFFHTEVVDIKLMYTLHFLENDMYHEQSLYVCFNIGNRVKKHAQPYRYLWSPWIESLRKQ